MAVNQHEWVCQISTSGVKIEEHVALTFLGVIGWLICWYTAEANPHDYYGINIFNREIS